MYQYVSAEITDGVGLIEVRRPESLNALNLECIKEMKDALDRFRIDQSVEVVVFKGAGDKAFVAGADIEELRKLNAIEILCKDGMHDFFNEIDRFEKPTIAMIQGFALGGGCELALACDFRIASSEAKIGLPELNLGIVPGAGGTQRLLLQIGLGNALYYTMTGKMIDAERALKIGLVSEVTNPENLEKEVFSIADRMRAKGPLALKLAKLAIKAPSQANTYSGLVIEKLAQSVLFATNDKEEGMAAFLEKRKPEFKSE
ncbi:enoyl-CoA hydratase/isomerase family protein [Bhargavaea beijingensis]|uniref:enoyl-CoA hydratase/isomerase family protein n=1 Tax=Bhargavaea beijingensis TaxID=426756 RepID=UPI002224CB86|nr:enoyl-CoA hydratase-related protein [Bhargavaea beijingensis]MCW1927384.1 enoyl-CoA hydratase-related protein [Bhargavaea beijingensis]